MAASTVLDEKNGSMKRSKFSEEQVVNVLRQAENGTPIGDTCRQLGIAEQTFYARKKQYAHLGVSKLSQLRQMEEIRPDSKGLSRISGSTSTGCQRLCEKRLRPARRRELAHLFHDTFRVSCLRACRLGRFDCAS